MDYGFETTAQVDVRLDSELKWYWRIDLYWGNANRSDQSVVSYFTYKSEATARRAAELWLRRLGVAERKDAAS